MRAKYLVKTFEYRTDAHGRQHRMSSGIVSCSSPQVADVICNAINATRESDETYMQAENVIRFHFMGTAHDVYPNDFGDFLRTADAAYSEFKKAMTHPKLRHD